MSESLNIGKTGNYEARVKVVLVTDMTEADRQREEWNLSNKAQRSLREAAGLNVNEPISSVVIKTRSNAVNGCAEPVMVWRRQYRIPIDSVRLVNAKLFFPKKGKIKLPKNANLNFAISLQR